MPVTLTNNYKEIFDEEIVSKIDNLLEENYALEDILEFIDANSEDDFNNYYEDYVEQGENLGYDVVDAFVEEFGLSEVENAEKSYYGEFRTEAEFAEEFTSEQYDIPPFVVIDWQETFEQHLYYDFAFVDGYVFRKHF